MITFAQAFIYGLNKFLSSSKKNMLFGLEVTNEGVGLKEKFDKQVYETPVSELSSTGTKLELEYFGKRYPLTVTTEPLLDPENSRLKS